MQATIPIPQPRVAASDNETAATDPCFVKARADLFASRPLRDRRIQDAADALKSGRSDEAKRLASNYLAKHPRDAEALKLMADIARTSGLNEQAEAYIAQSVHWSPDREAYRYNYAVVLENLNKTTGAIAETEKLLQKNPGNLLYRHLYGALLNKTERFAEALVWNRSLTQDYPQSPTVWLSLANTLRALGGHAEECIVAYRKAAELAPSMARAWWSLASLKTFRFTDAEIQLMEAQLARPAVSAESRAELYYALGKAYEDVKNYEKSFQNHARGNAIRRLDMDYDPDETTAMVARARTVFTSDFFRERAQAGCSSEEPIFVLGLQRAGSTLVEQILGSHSQIEEAGELPSILNLVGEYVMPKTGPDYPNGMDRLDPAELQVLGEKYLDLSRPRRPKGRPFFVDKCPFNLWHVGLIHLILPKARIIDVRRHPIGCCYANFTMNFIYAPPVSYKQTDIGRFYADYVRLMAHFDRVLPGKIHRVIYEHLVADLETEVRRMLDFIGLPFEQGCLEYYKSERSFNSYSNEQVRSPIFKEGIDRWRNYEPWLGPMKAALGPVLDAYPGVPEFDA